MITKLVKMLTSLVAPTDKLTMITALLRDPPILQAILTISLENDWRYSKVACYTRGVLTVTGKVDMEDVRKLYNPPGRTQNIITSTSLDLVRVLRSPSIIGVNKKSLTALLNKNPMTLEEAYGILELGEIQKAVELPTCPVCNRKMASASDRSPCSSCKVAIAEFTRYRRGTFKVPITVWNFKQLTGKSNDLPVEEHYIDYLVTKEDDQLVFTHAEPTEGIPIQFPLPFEEFAKSIKS